MDKETPEGEYTIRNATPEEVKIIVSEWEEEADWNPGVEDGNIFYIADPNGFFIGYIGEKPVSFVCGVKTPGGVGFIGMYLVKQ